MLFLTDIAGVLDKNWDLLKSLTCDDIDGLIKDETITGGMFPKGEIDDTFVICSFVCNCCVCAREKTYCISVYLTDYFLIVLNISS